MDLHLYEILNHLGEDRDSEQGPVSPPIHQTSNFRFKTVADLREAIPREMDSPVYTRGCNPTARTLREKIAALEGAEDCLVFGSGSAAIAAAVISQVKAGDHVVCVQRPYSWTFALLSKLLPRFGVETTFVDGTSLKEIERALKPNSRVIFLESPNSWLFELQDLGAISRLAKAKGLTTIIDNSCATPLGQSPIQSGIDIVVHSASKYLNGHSDVVAGSVCASRKIITAIFSGEYMTLGGILPPFESWLVLRGLRTLPLRIERISATTLKVVQFLENHPKIERVYYSHSPTHPQHALALSQMKFGGGLFSAQIKAKELKQVERFCDSLKRFLMACSWGGYESLIMPACAIPDPKALPWNMVRFSIGLEDSDLLIQDLDQALSLV